jgi:hypothetical protein
VDKNSTAFLQSEKFGDEMSAEWRPIMADAEMQKIPLNVSAFFDGVEFRLDVTLTESCARLDGQQVYFVSRAVEAINRVSDKFSVSVNQALGPSVRSLQERH